MSHLIIGCGYLGGRVLERWLAAGHRVQVTTRSLERAESLRRRGAEPIVCDVLNPESLRDLPPGDVVLYAVGLDRAAGRSMREVYVAGLANVLDALPPPGRLIYVSSTSVYGQKNGEEVDEEAATDPAEESGRIVLEAENLLRSRRAEAVILRFAGIYGSGRLLRQKAIEAGEVLAGDPEKWLNLIHVDDGAAAVCAAEARAQPGRVVNISDGCPVRRREYFTLLAQLLKAPEPRFGPAAVAEMANRRIVNRRMIEELGVQLRYASFAAGLPAAVGG